LKNAIITTNFTGKGNGALEAKGKGVAIARVSVRATYCHIYLNTNIANTIFDINVNSNTDTQVSSGWRPFSVTHHSTPDIKDTDKVYSMQKRKFLVVIVIGGC